MWCRFLVTFATVLSFLNVTKQNALFFLPSLPPSLGRSILTTCNAYNINNVGGSGRCQWLDGIYLSELGEIFCDGVFGGFWLHAAYKQLDFSFRLRLGFLGVDFPSIDLVRSSLQCLESEQKSKLCINGRHPDVLTLSKPATCLKTTNPKPLERPV